MKVLLTGHSGFIGGWICSDLHKRNWDLTCVDRKSCTENALLVQLGVQARSINEHVMCLREYKSVENLINKIKPDLIIHAAAQALIPVAFRDPYGTFLDNSLGTINIFESIRSLGLDCKVIAITSDKVYENFNDGRLFAETDELGGKDVYSVTKSNVEFISRAYANVHSHNANFKIHTVRLGNVVGGADWNFDRLMPDVIRSAMHGNDFNLRMVGAERPFQHVVDVVDGVLTISQHIISDSSLAYDNWNLGPKDNTYLSVERVLELAQQILGTFKINLPAKTVKEDKLLRVSVDKYAAYFGDPKFTSEEAVIQTLHWYKINAQNPFTFKNYNEPLNAHS